LGFVILAINPGSTSTKVALFQDEEELGRKELPHRAEDLAGFPRVADQKAYRLGAIEALMEARGRRFEELSAVVGRGGIVDPIPGGTYRVGPLLLEHLHRGKPWEHASNLGGILAEAIASPLGIPSFIVDPVAVDELEDLARITGLPELPLRSLVHALNVKATVRLAARDLNRDWQELSVVVAHLGSGFSICAHREGRIVDVNNANERGPFSPERAGGVPALELVRLAYSGRWTQQDLRRRLVGRGGLSAYLGTTDLREAAARIAAGDEGADRVVEAMAFQVAQEIAAMAVPLRGKVDAVILTGGVAHSSDFVARVQRRVEWIAPVLRYPGEDEMKALCQGALRVLRGEEEPRDYERFAGGTGER